MYSAKKKMFRSHGVLQGGQVSAKSANNNLKCMKKIHFLKSKKLSRIFLLMNFIIFFAQNYVQHIFF